MIATFAPSTGTAGPAGRFRQFTSRVKSNESMSGRSRMVLADGRFTTYRKTLARRAKSTPMHLRPDFTVALVLTNGHSVRAGETFGITGIQSLPGGRIVCEAKSKDWALGQVRAFLKRMGIARHQAVVSRAAAAPFDSAPARSGYERVVWIEVGPAPGSYLEKHEDGILALRQLPMFCEG